TLVTSVAPIAVDSARPVPAMAVHVSTVEYPFDPRTGAAGEGVYRFVVPPAAAAQPLAIELPSGLREPRVWMPDGEWLELERPEGADGFAVPADAVRAGAVLVQVDSSEEFGFGMDPFTIAPELKGVASDG
ncbi:MAG: hypothetical protein ACRDZ2_01870, partial [Ilumatobacteraceae bacterium]